MVTPAACPAACPAASRPPTSDAPHDPLTRAATITVPRPRPRCDSTGGHAGALPDADTMPGDCAPGSSGPRTPRTEGVADTSTIPTAVSGRRHRGRALVRRWHDDAVAGVAARSCSPPSRLVEPRAARPAIPAGRP